MLHCLVIDLFNGCQVPDWQVSKVFALNSTDDGNRESGPQRGMVDDRAYFDDTQPKFLPVTDV